jgi:hypothetical protein
MDKIGKICYNNGVLIFKEVAMNNEEKFKFDIANLKTDFAVENMAITNDDINMLRKLNNNEITMNETINNIKKTYIQGV